MWVRKKNKKEDEEAKQKTRKAKQNPTALSDEQGGQTTDKRVTSKTRG